MGGVAAYVLLSGEEQSSETIKIGVIADIDNIVGKSMLQGAKLAAEQVNAEGGVLGRNFEIVAEDNDIETPSFDMVAATNALTKLITVHEAAFIVSYGLGMTYREIAFEHKKILFTVYESTEKLTQGVLEDYDRYKYYFRGGTGNLTAAIKAKTAQLVGCRNLTGFNKVAFIYYFVMESMVSAVIESLEENGFDVVLSEPITNILDASTAFAKAEDAGAEILYPFIFSSAGIPFIKEYYERQSPMVIWGSIDIASTNDFWQLTEGRCEFITNTAYPVEVGYPLTSKSLSTRNAYIERWDEEISGQGAATYDLVRFILPDAIERAGTIDTDAVIEALEKTDVETSICRHFVFTPSHDIMALMEDSNKPSDDYYFVAMFQWQDGVQVPVYPIKLKEEAGATYTFPDWPGPWD